MEFSGKHSLTPYPSLSPYRRTDRQTDRETNTLTARGLEELFFQLCVSVIGSGGKYGFDENYEVCFLAGSFVDQIMPGKKGTVIWPSVGINHR